MAWRLKMVIPEIPPSANNLYGQDRRTGKRYLTAQGRKFQEMVKKTIIPYLPLLSQMPNDLRTVFVIRFNVYFELTNRTWGAPKNPAKTRYKKWDVSNRIKALEDALRSALTDDMYFFSVTVNKFHEPDESRYRVEVYIEESDPRMFGVPDDKAEE